MSVPAADGSWISTAVGSSGLVIVLVGLVLAMVRVFVAATWPSRDQRHQSVEWSVTTVTALMTGFAGWVIVTRFVELS